MQTPGRSPRKAAAIFIFITVMLDMIAFGLIGPILPKLISSFVGGNLATAAWIVTVFAIAWACVQFFASPIFGAVSDRIGRRPLILLSNIGTGIDYTIMALAPNIPWLFAGRLLSGATTASMSTAFAYIADSSTPQTRAKAYGMIGAAFGLGFIIGPALGGVVAFYFNARAPFWVAAVLSVLNFAYGYFVLPESLDKEHRTARIDWSKANPVGAIQFLRDRKSVLGLATVNFLGYIAHEAYPIVWVLYTMARFNWNILQIGSSLMLVGATSVLSSLFLVGPVVKRFGERTTLLLGLGFAVVAYAFFGFSTSGWMFVSAILISALGLYGPASQALMSHRVGPKEQGALQGALGAVRSVTMILGPAIFGTVFAQFIGPWRYLALEGAPWLLAGLFMVIALGVAVAVTNKADDINVPATPIDIEALNPEV